MTGTTEAAILVNTEHTRWTSDMVLAAQGEPNPPKRYMAWEADAMLRGSSWSSRRMSDLMIWRNKEGPFLFKKVGTQIALPFLTITAAIEALAYKIFSLTANCFLPLTSKLSNFARNNRINELYSSASFTTWWTLTALWKNFRQSALPSYERDLR